MTRRSAYIRDVRSHAQPESRRKQPSAAEQPEQPEQPALRAWVALARCYTTVVREAAKDVARHGLSLSQFAVLEALYHKGRLALGEISALLLVTGGNITYMVDELEARGYVARERCTEDRRVVYAALTPQGTKLLDRIFPEHARCIADMFSALDPQELAEFRRLVKKLGQEVAERGR